MIVVKRNVDETQPVEAQDHRAQGTKKSGINWNMELALPVYTVTESQFQGAFGDVMKKAVEKKKKGVIEEMKDDGVHVLTPFKVSPEVKAEFKSGEFDEKPPSPSKVQSRKNKKEFDEKPSKKNKKEGVNIDAKESKEDSKEIGSDSGPGSKKVQIGNVTDSGEEIPTDPGDSSIESVDSSEEPSIVEDSGILYYDDPNDNMYPSKDLEGPPDLPAGGPPDSDEYDDIDLGAPLEPLGPGKQVKLRSFTEDQPPGWC